VALNRDSIALRVRQLTGDSTIPADCLDSLITWAVAWSGGSESNDVVAQVIAARFHVLMGIERGSK